jgi:hypothetical protein
MRNPGRQEKSWFMVSLSKQRFIQRLLTSSPTSITNGFAGVWFRQEKPLRFRAGPAGSAGAAATSAVRRDIFVEPQPKINLAPLERYIPTIRR